MADPHAEIALGRLTGIYGLPAPKDWPQLSIDDPTELEVQAARKEIAEQPSLPYPSMASVVANHPGVAGYQIMTDPEYQQAVKYDNLMRRLDAIKSARGGMAFRESPTAGLLTDGTYKPEPMRDRSFWGRYWGSQPHAGTEQLPPYRHRGVLAPGQPVRNFMELWMAPFSAVANTGVRSLYDLDKAANEAPEVANKMFGGIPRAVRTLTEPGYKGEINADWATEQKVVESLAFDDPLMIHTRGNPSKFYLQIPRENTPGVVEGAQILEELGYPEHWSRDLIGMGAESLVDPASGFGLVAKSIGRAGRYASPAARNAALRHAAGGLASEAAPAVGWTALMESLRRAQESR